MLYFREQNANSYAVSTTDLRITILCQRKCRQLTKFRNEHADPGDIMNVNYTDDYNGENRF